ncbi:hypothetical protein GO730_23515 [Spirosoma sp. HMF3257]|uniref:Lipocalin-like domain-containing protein n=1 Tax=Spirosoma telluris TaxID=2183553 RepID=A0A327NM15_9BACT|nr:hypothetical protein [Spirosoma telluris]RAI76380.1 hypothetical protein HMF3257_23450 [Spirosoma telluris]
MKTVRLIPFSIFLTLLVFSCEKPMCGCVFPPSPLVGEWALATITYGLSQKTVTAAEAGYSETISFDGLVEGGNYRQVRNGLPILTSQYSLSFPKGGSTEGVIFFQKDSTEQSFRLAETTLYLTERIPRGAVIADGSTYAYKRQ